MKVAAVWADGAQDTKRKEMLVLALEVKVGQRAHCSSALPYYHFVCSMRMNGPTRS